MESRYILKKDHLPGLLRRLRKKFRVVAPVLNQHGDTLYSRADASAEINLEPNGQPQGSPKRFFLPQQEVLFTYRIGKPEGYLFTPVAENHPPTVYFGLRSCDLAAILYTDVVFLKGGRDPDYQRRRQESILINLGCNEPTPNCFCNATKSGPFLESGYDLQLTDLGDRFFVEVGRVRGQELINELRIFFSEATEQEGKDSYQMVFEAHGSFSRHVDIEQVAGYLAENGCSEELWSELAARCQDCGGCAFLCPTCTCYTIRDQPLTTTSGERLREWDACTHAGFTRMAGGQNPVDRSRHGLRRRFEHKLRDSIRQHGRPSCVGCGRCVGICFGGVDILMFIDRLTAESEG
jgi:sulfhydrogenase subunit beta (sulfur reductase)